MLLLSMFDEFVDGGEGLLEAETWTLQHKSKNPWKDQKAGRA